MDRSLAARIGLWVVMVQSVRGRGEVYSGTTIGWCYEWGAPVTQVCACLSRVRSGYHTQSVWFDNESFT